jgi:1,2-dihydroxy-3-keto-5-methylthiopentene dioxygenase
MHAYWLDDGETISEATLGGHGVLTMQLDTNASHYRAPLDAFALRHGYVEEDQVSLSPETPSLEAICAKFTGEHLHTEDEVRFVLEGEGIFDIRSTDSRWMRVEVSAGDLIVVPKDRYHRFFLTDRRTIRCVRLFQDASGWTPHYRV